MTEKKPTRSSGKTGDEVSARSVLDVSQLPEELGPDYEIFIKPDYVRAKIHEDGEGYDVVSLDDAGERVLTPLAADVFNSQYAVVKPNKVLNYAWVPK